MAKMVTMIDPIKFRFQAVEACVISISATFILQNARLKYNPPHEVYPAVHQLATGTAPLLYRITILPYLFT
jgi:hypothetical protein